MQVEKIRQKVKFILADKLDASVKSIISSSFLVDDLDMDSVSAIEVGHSIEEKFHVKIAREHFVNISTVQDVIDYISKHLKTG